MPVVVSSSRLAEILHVQIGITLPYLFLYKKGGIISICLYPFRLFEVFHNYRPGRADK